MDKEQNKKLDDLTEDVRSLKFDNERIVKPALKDIREILSRDIYTPKTDHTELKAEVEKLRQALAEETKKTTNYVLVERLVFGLVGLVLLEVATALVYLVVRSNS